VAVDIPKDMRDTLTKFDSDADVIIAPLKSTLMARATPSLLYHYTSDIGSRGILESGLIWLSDMFRLNDPSELRHGFSHAVQILSEKAKTGPEEAKLFAEIFEDVIADSLERTAHYFVCSFSANGDELGQWRAYADNGRGYALGFDGKALENAFGRDASSSTYHITYDDDVLVDIQRRLVEGMFHLISFDLISRGQADRVDGATVAAYMKELAVALAKNALEAALFFKHEAYENEAEFRFRQLYKARVPVPGLKRRYRSSEVVKYREFEWRSVNPGVLKRIVVGPAVDRHKGKRFVEDCLDLFDIDIGSIELVHSGVPYRTV
jgi:hypothetical protein